MYYYFDDFRADPECWLKINHAQNDCFLMAE